MPNVATDTWRLTDGVEIVGPALQDLVSTNATLSTFGIWIGPSIQHPESDANWTVNFVVRGLERNRNLKVLDFSKNGYSRRAVEDASTSEEIVNLLRNHNTTLTDINGLTYLSEPHGLEINWLLKLNRYKRQFLLDPGLVPAGVWKYVFRRLQVDRRVDVMYHFVNGLIRRSVVTPEPITPRRNSWRHSNGLYRQSMTMLQSHHVVHGPVQLSMTLPQHNVSYRFSSGITVQASAVMPQDDPSRYQFIHFAAPPPVAIPQQEQANNPFAGGFVQNGVPGPVAAIPRHNESNHGRVDLPDRQSAVVLHRDEPRSHGRVNAQDRRSAVPQHEGPNHNFASGASAQESAGMPRSGRPKRKRQRRR
jgi:hypothetical protein